MIDTIILSPNPFPRDLLIKRIRFYVLRLQSSK
jgi:hypothetical protein